MSQPIAIGSVMFDESAQLNVGPPPPGYKYVWVCLKSIEVVAIASHTPGKNCLQLVPV